MTDWSDLKYVLETVRQGGLSGAARVLGVNHATVSRRISAAEQTLGALLFDRLPGGYAPTEAGLDAVRAAERMEEADVELSLLIGSRDRALSGRVTVTAPQLMIERVLADIFADFCQLHPEIELRVLATNEPLNLSRREADVAIRISDAPTETLFGTRAAEQRAAVFTSHDYADKLRADPNNQLDWIRFLHWPGLPEEIRSVWPNQRVALAVDDMVAAIGAVRAGIGATRMPCFLGDSDPQLTRLAGLSTFAYPSVWVLTLADLRRVPRNETFMQFVSAKLRKRQKLFDGSNIIVD
ncbi:MAG: LysR family transcriptional regulator [Hyphomicrobiales bacterium]|nr:LysR family transcriptional regulator [Hyphomicrobiales bacterium]